jgi:LPXTG-site transpeptidase (sortase) family protein
VLLLIGALGVFLYATRPAVMLGHPDPHAGTQPNTGNPLAPLTGILTYPAAPPESAPAPVAPRTGSWIEAPSMDIALPIQKGDGSDRIPAWVALTYPHTAAPGAAGNSYLYAHGYWGMFGGLLYARAGDAVSIHDYATGKVTTFHVSRVVGRTRYNDTTWLRTLSTKPLLTLQTCVDDNPKGDRYIVQAS